EFLAARAALDNDDEAYLIGQAGKDEWREVIILAAALGGRPAAKKGGFLAKLIPDATGNDITVGEWIVRELLRRGNRDKKLRPRRRNQSDRRRRHGLDSRR